MWQPGDRVGAYRIDGALASGGMGSLFLGHRMGAAGFARSVALKVIRASLATQPEFVRLFVNEALISARVDHPSVVRVEELFELDGLLVLVMEYVDGCSLRVLMRSLLSEERRLTADVATHIGIQVASGLHAAHESCDESGRVLGIVHSDVSPDNILISRQGHVKLADFGIARVRGWDSGAELGSVRGKLRYMAPEQIAGRPIDRRTDIYAAGIVLWEMLTGSRYFEAESDLALLDSIRHPRARSPSATGLDVPPLLDAAVLRAIQPEPEDRFQSAKALSLALAEAQPSALMLGTSHLAELLEAAPLAAVTTSHGAPREPHVSSLNGHRRTSALTRYTVQLQAAQVTRTAPPTDVVEVCEAPRSPPKTSAMLAMSVALAGFAAVWLAWPVATSIEPALDAQSPHLVTEDPSAQLVESTPPGALEPGAPTRSGTTATGHGALVAPEGPNEAAPAARTSERKPKGARLRQGRRSKLAATPASQRPDSMRGIQVPIVDDPGL